MFAVTVLGAAGVVALPGRLGGGAPLGRVAVPHAGAASSLLAGAGPGEARPRQEEEGSGRLAAQAAPLLRLFGRHGWSVLAHQEAALSGQGTQGVHHLGHHHECLHRLLAALLRTGTRQAVSQVSSGLLTFAPYFTPPFILPSLPSGKLLKLLRKFPEICCQGFLLVPLLHFRHRTARLDSQGIHCDMNHGRLLSGHTSYRCAA